MAQTIDELFPDKTQQSSKPKEKPRQAGQQRQSIDELFPEKQPQKQVQQRTIENPAEIINDVLRYYGGGPAVEMSAGFEGMDEIAQSGGMDASAERVRGVQRGGQAFTAPRTETGKRVIDKLNKLVEQGVDLARLPVSGLAGLTELIMTGDPSLATDKINQGQEQGQFNIAGDATLEMTGSPALATAVSMGPEIAGSIGGGGAPGAASRSASRAASRGATLSPKALERNRLVGADGEPRRAFEKALEEQGLTFEDVMDDLEGLPKGIDARTAALRIQQRQMKNDRFTAGTADKRLGNKGIEEDPYATEAIKQGVDRSDIAAIKSANAATQDKMRNMLRIRRQISRNSAKAINVDPSEVVGKSAMQRYEFLVDRVRKNSKNLNELVNNEIGDRPVNMEAVGQGLMDEFEEMNVGFRATDSGTPEIRFEGSDISADPAAQRVIQDSVRLMSEMGNPTVKTAHRLKKQLDGLLDYKKASTDLTPKGQKVVETLRRRINAAIQDKSSEYARLNTEMSTALGPIKALEKTLGRRIDITSPTADRSIGTDMRSILSNNKTAGEKLDIITNLDSASRKLGRNFSDNLGDLVNFNGTLQTQFGSTRRNSLGGNIQAENQRQTREMMEAGVGRRGAVDMVVDYGAEKLNQMRGINEEQRFKALSRLINKAYKNGTKPKSSSTEITPFDEGSN